MSDIRAQDQRVARWLSDGPTELPLPVRTAVVEGLRMTPRARRPLLTGDDVRRRWVLLAAAALLVAAMAAAAVIGSRLLEERPAIIPELGPLETAELVVGSVRTTPFTYRLPVGLGLVRQDSPEPGLGYVTFTTGGPPPYGWSVEGGPVEPTARGIVVADLTDVTFHGSLVVRTLRKSTPARFLSDLDAGPEFQVSNAVAGRLGSLDSLVADVLIDEPDHWTHLDILAGSMREGSIDFANPSRLYLAEVEDLLVAVQVWAPTSADLEAWLPVATRFVDTIEFPARTSQRPDESGSAILRAAGGTSVAVDWVLPGALELDWLQYRSGLRQLVFFAESPAPYGILGSSVVPGARGVIVMDATASNPHGMDTPALAGDPDGFVAGLAQTNFDNINERLLEVGDIGATELGGLPAMAITTRLAQPAMAGSVHLEIVVGGTGYTEAWDLRLPSRLIVAQVGSTTVLVQIYAESRTAFEAWLPKAMTLVDSLRLSAVVE